MATIFLFVGTALLARGEMRTVGILTSAVGLSISVHSLSVSGSPELAAFGLFFTYLTPVLIAHTLLIYPRGSFDNRVQTWLVTLGYLEALVLPIPWLLVTDPSLYCGECAKNPMVLIADEGVSQSLDVVRLMIAAIITVGLAIAMTHRWHLARPSERIALGPPIGTVGFAIGGFAVLFCAELARPDPAVRIALNIVVLTLLAAVPLSIVYGQMKSRLRRAEAVRGLVAALGSNHGSSTSVEAELAIALEDPTLQLVYWLPGQGRFIDSSGRETPWAQVGARRWFKIYAKNGEPKAAVIYDESIGDQSELLTTVLSMDNPTLESNLRAQVAELKGSRHMLVEAVDSERRRVERDLHDGAQQHLISIALNLSFAANEIASDPKTARSMVNQAAHDITCVTEDLRRLARGVHSAVLADRGLGAAIETLANRSALPVQILALTDVRFSSEIESTAYFVVAESLANATRASGAKGVTVKVCIDNYNLLIEVQDEGIGGADPSRGTGLTGLQSRVETLGGTLVVASPVGSGTLVRARLPLSDRSTGEGHPAPLVGGGRFDD